MSRQTVCGMPRTKVRYRANSRFAAADRKYGRWTNRCETVFEFHHRPTATSGAAGARSNRAPCPAASATERMSP
jgi:hypothetical protein